MGNIFFSVIPYFILLLKGFKGGILFMKEVVLKKKTIKSKKLIIIWALF